MAYNSRPIEYGDMPRRVPRSCQTGAGGPVLVEPWQQRRRKPSGQVPAGGQNATGKRRIPAPRPRRRSGPGGGRRRHTGASRMLERQIWRGAGGGGRPPGRRRRRRRNKWLPLALCLLVLLVVTGVVKLATGGRDDTVAGPNPNDEMAPIQVTPYNGETFVLVLDAGHGGEDPGALSPDKNVYESTVTREMLNRVVALFAERQQAAVQVVVTTGEGETVDSREDRAAVANSAGADLFLSLHLNSDKKSSVNGFQAYAQPPGFATNPQSVYFSELLAARVGATTSLKLIGGSGVYYMFYEDRNTPLPYEYTLGIPSSHAGLDTFGVLQHAKCPAVLIEQWFITNAGDMAAMYNDSGMNTMAECIYSAVCEYFGLNA